MPPQMGKPRVGQSDLPKDLVQILNTALELAAKNNIVLVGVAMIPRPDASLAVELVRQGNINPHVLGDYLKVARDFLTTGAEEFADSFSTRILKGGN